MLLKAAAENRHRDNDDDHHHHHHHHHHYHHHGGMTTITNVKYTFQAVGYGYELCNQIMHILKRDDRKTFPRKDYYYSSARIRRHVQKVSIDMNLASRYHYDVIFPQFLGWDYISDSRLNFVLKCFYIIRLYRIDDGVGVSLLRIETKIVANFIFKGIESVLKYRTSIGCNNVLFSRHQIIKRRHHHHHHHHHHHNHRHHYRHHRRPHKQRHYPTNQ
uniref:Uncharacterized protein n=1 Tax=Glossina palpalis gambiensis TaxID=67801 RepID=A0A1B0B7J0_9MUSC